MPEPLTITKPVVYQLRVVLRSVSPLIWRESISNQGHYNAYGLTPGGLLVTNEDALFPEFRGNDPLQGLIADPGPGIDAFGAALDAFLRDLPVRPVLLGNVYDPTFGDDARNFLGVEPALARRNQQRLMAVHAELGARYGRLVDLHARFLRGSPSWFVHTIEPSLTGVSEVRRAFRRRRSRTIPEFVRSTQRSGALGTHS